MGAHALLAPSSSSRWFECPPSARSEEPYENTDSPAAREGTLAHEIAEELLRAFVLSGVLAMEMPTWKAFKEKEFYTQAMFEHAQGFARFVLKEHVGNSLLFIEQPLNLRKWIPEGFGRSDAAVLNLDTKTLYVSDLKYGQGVLVEAPGNKQLRIYALGVLEDLDIFGYEIDNVVMRIYQPRLQNIDEDIISAKDLLLWADNELKPKADLAWAGAGEYKAGKHCKFCRAAGACRKLAEFSQDLAKTEFSDNNILSDEETMDIFGKLDILESWAKKVKEFTLAEALKGKEWPGYKVVEGISKRSYRNEAAVEKVILEKLQRSDFCQPKKLLGLGDMEKLLGGEAFAEHIVPLLIKPKGAPALAPLSDKRPLYSSAAADFKQDYTDEDDCLN